VIVIDTNVVVAGVRSPAGASAELLRLVLLGRIEAAASTALVLEYEAVITRAEHLSAARLSVEQASSVVDALAAAMTPTPIRWRLRPLSPDPGDDLVLEAAFNAGAQAIVSTNLADLEQPALRLGIRTVLPNVLLSELER
jgi:putative PIN family toxin of toxin-antitoxin system